MVEVLIAAVVLLIGVLGFVGTVGYAATATAVGNRRTALSFLRSGLVDRLAVTSRGALGAPATTWVIDSCWDGNSQLLAQNSAYSTSTSLCPANTLYRSWLCVANPSSGAAATCPNVSTPTPTSTSSCATGGSCYQVSLYVERTDGGCTQDKRYNSLGCVAADLLLTD